MNSRSSRTSAVTRKREIKPSAKRKPSEPRLTRFPDQLEVILRNVAEGITVQEPGGKLIYANHAAARLNGFSTPEELLQAPLDRVWDRFEVMDESGKPFPPDLAPGRIALQGRQPKEQVLRIRIKATGEERWSIVNASPVLDKRGRPRLAVNIFRDITELKQAAAALEQLASIVESSSEAIIGKDLDAIITSWNRGAEQLYGYTAREMIGRSVSILVPPDLPDELPSIMERLKRGERIEHFETDRVAKDGRRIQVEISISPLRNQSGVITGASTIARDISKRRRAEADQRFLIEASELLADSLDYEATLDRVARLAVPEFADWCAVDIVRPDGTYEQIALAHKDPDKLKLGYELQRKYPPRGDDTAGVRNVLRTGKPEMMSDIPDEMLVAAAVDEEHLRLMRYVGIKSYMVVPLVAREHALGAITFVSGESNRRYTQEDLAFSEILASRMAIAIDNARLYAQTQKMNEQLEQRVVDRTFELITANRRLEEQIEERRRAQQELEASYVQLRALASRLQAVREEERTRIAREMHDELGQALTALKFDLSSIASRLPMHNEVLRAQTQAMSGQIDATIRVLRRISTELRPGMLDDLGLAAAIEWQAHEFASRTGVECEVRLPKEEIELERDRATAVFRIFQETLTNVTRHAHANKVVVNLESEGDSIRLQVRDNGRGFDTAEAQAKRSLGLLGMQERAEILGGRFGVESHVGQGTTVTVSMPL